MAIAKRPAASLLNAYGLSNNRTLLVLLRSFLSTKASKRHADKGTEGTTPLVRLTDARLGYPASDTGRQRRITKPLDLTVFPASHGGHALLGRNGLGKTLISNALVAHEDYLQDGSFFAEHAARHPRHSTATAHVSFESHEALLTEGGTAYRAIGSGGSNLTKAAQFLVVRFGLFPLLHRDVTTLSTGEIRKVLLVRALAHRPNLLILDNAFDGLDVVSRDSLKDLVSKTLLGFRPDILVQGVNASATAHTQVFMITQRAEEVVSEIETISFLNKNGNLLSETRNGRPHVELLSAALDLEMEDAQHEMSLIDNAWDDTTLPSLDAVASWWESGGDNASDGVTPVVQTDSLHFQRGDATLLCALSWTVQRGERWLVAGSNGSGKSTLSRLVAKEEEARNDSQELRGHLIVATGSGNNGATPQRDGSSSRDGVGWVSTELHMTMSRSNKTALEVLHNEGKTSPYDAETVCKWLDLDQHSILSRPFTELSQGQQKLVLIAAAIASRPQLLVLDEPCQGLDLINRRRLLGLVERVCQASNMSLVYVTHHLEEMLPCVGHVLHLQEGRAVFNGTRDDYDPENISSEQDQVA